jgi:hypothetical protein
VIKAHPPILQQPWRNPTKVFFALGSIGPEPFAQTNIVFKSFAITHEVIDGEDGLRWAT